MKTLAALAFALAMIVMSGAVSTPVKAQETPGAGSSAPVMKSEPTVQQARRPKLVIITIQASSREEAEQYAWGLGNFFINTRYNGLDMHNGYWVVIGTTLVPGVIVDNHVDKRAVRFEFGD
jgi:hypothetical protein